MSVEISVVTRGSLSRIQRTELRNLNSSVASFLHNWSDRLGVPTDCGDWDCPHVVTTSATVEAAQAVVIRQSIGTCTQLTVEELDDLLAAILFEDQEGYYLNLLCFLETGSIAVPDEAFSNMQEVGEIVVPLPALVADLESVLTNSPSVTHHIASSDALAGGFLQWLLGAAKWCLDRQEPLYCIVKVDKWDGWTTIRDRRIGEQGFNRFKKASVDEKGGLLVRFFSGASYRIPCKYLKALVGASAGNSMEPCRLQRARILRGREQIRIEFSEGTMATLTWGDILMAFEPMYEHFGGFSEDGRKMIETWNRLHPPFRVHPRKGA